MDREGGHVSTYAAGSEPDAGTTTTSNACGSSLAMLTRQCSRPGIVRSHGTVAATVVDQEIEIDVGRGEEDEREIETERTVGDENPAVEGIVAPDRSGEAPSLAGIDPPDELGRPGPSFGSRSTALAATAGGTRRRPAIVPSRTRRRDRVRPRAAG